MAVVRGVVVSFDSGSWTAAVRFSPGQAAIAGIAVAEGIDDAEIDAGDKVVVDLGPNNDYADAVVIAVYS